MTGCGGDQGEGSGTAKPGGPGHDSPQAAFSGILQYFQNGEIDGAMLQWLAPDVRAPMVFQLWMGMKIKASNQENLVNDFLAIKEKHAIPDMNKFTEGVDAEALSEPTKLKALAEKVLAGKDLPALLDDIVPFLKKIGNYPMKIGKKPVKVEKVTVLGENEDKARGTVVFEDDSKDRVEFVKVDGKWFVVPMK